MSTYECACSASGKAGLAAVFREGSGEAETKSLPGPPGSEIVAAIFGGIARWYRFRRTMSELRRLDGRMLRDIGLERDQIEAVAHSLAARDGGSRLRG